MNGNRMMRLNSEADSEIVHQYSLVDCEKVFPISDNNSTKTRHPSDNVIENSVAVIVLVGEDNAGSNAYLLPI
jgi:hypothetical protein